MNERLPATVIEKPEVQQLESAPPQAAAPLLPEIWRRRWTVMSVLLIALAGGFVYLLFATRIFTARSNLYIEQNGVKILSDSQGGLVARSDSYLFTQVEVIRSAPILRNALERVNYKRMRTFAKVDNPLSWLQEGSEFRVEVGKKDDVVTVELDSPYAQEAADLVNAIVDAYMTSQSRQKKTTANDILQILSQEKDKRDAEFSKTIKALVKFKQDNGALSFVDDKGNIILQRLALLSQNLTTAELEKMKTKVEFESAKLVLSDPIHIHNFVQTLQNKGSSAGDRELDGLRDEIQKGMIAKATLDVVHGPNSASSKILASQLTALKDEIERHEKRIAEAHLSDAADDLAAAQKEEDETRAAFEAQEKVALELNSKSAELQNLMDDRARIQKQCDMLDDRLKEVNVNQNDGALNIQILDVAHPEDKPSKPRKALIMGGALLVGLILGIGLALLREYIEHRLRSPDEVTATLGLPVLGVVPRMHRRMTVQVRGQQVHRDSMSDVAEAYRTVRTGIQFSATPGLKTILVTSPRPGDGKSTAASNLAIAMAQAGLRTLLLDADFRKPVQHKIFEVEDKVGTASVISGQSTLRDAIRRTNVPHLCVLPCGPLPDNPSEMIVGPRFTQVMEALAGSFDRIVIDSPPVMAVADARILSASADVTLLVVRINKTPRKASTLALDGLRRVGAGVLGVIVNDMPRTADGSGYGYNGYRYYGGGYNGKRNVNLADALPSMHSDSRFVPEETVRLPIEALALGAPNGSDGNKSGNGEHSNGSANGHANGSPVNGAPA